MNKEIKKVIVKLFIFIIIAVIADFSVGFILEKIFFNQTAGPDYRTNYIINECEADMIILGSSRANHHYVPDVISKKLDLSVFNAGRDGQFILYHYAILKSLTERHIPKHVVLDINPGEFAVGRKDYAKLSYLLPYYKKHDVIKEVVNKRSKYEQFKFCSQIYPYNSTILSAFAFSLDIDHPLFNSKTKDNHGYLPLYGDIGEKKQDTVKIREIDLDEEKTTYLHKIIDLCKTNNIDLNIVVSPLYYYMDLEKSKIKSFINSLGEDVYLLNTIPEICNNPKYFRDLSHLNHQGAIKYSELFVKILQNKKAEN